MTLSLVRTNLELGIIYISIFDYMSPDLPFDVTLHGQSSLNILCRIWWQATEALGFISKWKTTCKIIQKWYCACLEVLLFLYLYFSRHFFINYFNIHVHCFGNLTRYQSTAYMGIDIELYIAYIWYLILSFSVQYWIILISDWALISDYIRDNMGLATLSPRLKWSGIGHCLILESMGRGLSA